MMQNKLPQNETHDRLLDKLCIEKKKTKPVKIDNLWLTNIH